MAVTAANPNNNPPAEDPAVKAIKRVSNEAQLSEPQLGAAEDKGKASPVAVVSLNVATAKRRDLTGCPPDFVEAYEKRTRALQKVLSVAMKYEKEVPTIEKFMAIGNLHPDDVTSESHREIVAVLNESREARKALEKVAAGYGVTYAK